MATTLAGWLVLVEVVVPASSQSNMILMVSELGTTSPTLQLASKVLTLLFLLPTTIKSSMAVVASTANTHVPAGIRNLPLRMMLIMTFHLDGDDGTESLFDANYITPENL
jgi:hypothetical protein